jgi:predicted RNA-binding protein with PUA-like domain
MAYWLMKSEPETFSFEDLVKSPKRTASWEGVRNYQARNFMRDDFKVGDKVLFYHSNADVIGIMGLAEVVKPGYPDHHALDPKSHYFDPDAKKKGVSPWIMVDIKATHRLKNPVTREILKLQPSLKKMMVLQKGARLSVQPVTAEEYAMVTKLGSPIKL